MTFFKYVHKMEAELHVMLQALLGSTTSSVRVAATLAEHRGSEVSKEDMVAGLLYRLMTPMSSEEMALSLRDGRNLGALILDQDSGESSDEEEADGAASLEKAELTSTNAIGTAAPESVLSISTYTCNCAVCMQTRICIQNYKDFFPPDDATALMHRGLLRSMEQHNVSIKSE